MQAFLFLAMALATSAHAASVAGRHWDVRIDRLACEAERSLIAVGMRIRYQGPAGLAEAPVSRLVDGNGQSQVPRSMVWKGGGKPLAAWLAAGGIRTATSGEASEMELRFAVRDAPGLLKLEFGDLPAVALTRADAGASKDACARLLNAGKIVAPSRARAKTAAGGTSMVRVYRAAYPCLPARGGAPRIVEAPYPPYLPEQLLVFGRGYLPSLREVELPMGRAPAQTYVYAGQDDLDPFEAQARRAVLEDFPGHGARHFAFNWGIQDAAQGNKIYSIGLYALKPCAP
jgi:hypothetical protein